MLGDGYISMGDRFNYPKINGRLEFTFSVQNLPYLRYLKFVLYAPFCTNSEPTPWPNPKTTNKLHSIDFQLDNYLYSQKYIKFDIKKSKVNMLKFYPQILKNY